MEREHLPLDRAMLFVFTTEGQWTFWMKNTFIPLDIIWFNEAGEIVDIQTMVPEPGKPDGELTLYNPQAPALYALEMNGGLAETYQFSPGMKVTLDLENETSA